MDWFLYDNGLRHEIVKEFRDIRAFILYFGVIIMKAVVYKF